MTKLIFLLALLLVSGARAGSVIYHGGGGGGGGAAAWGSITGTLSSQADLNTALGLKAPLASPTFTGKVTLPSGSSTALNTTTNGFEFSDHTGFFQFGNGNPTPGVSYQGINAWSWGANHLTLGDGWGASSYDLTWDQDGFGNIGTSAGGGFGSATGNPSHAYIINDVNVGYSTTSGGVFNLRGNGNSKVTWGTEASTNGIGSSVSSGRPYYGYFADHIGVGSNGYTGASGSVYAGSAGASEYAIIGSAGYTSSDLQILFNDNTDAYGFSLVKGSGVVTYGHAPNSTGVFASAITFDHANGLTLNSGLKVKVGNYHLEPCENNAGNSGTAITVDLSTCAAQKVTITGNVTFTLSNPVTGGTYVFKLVQDATGSRTYTWPAAVKWAGGTAPTGSAATKTDLINLYYDGTNYYGSYSLNY